MSSLHQRAKDVFLVALAQTGSDRSAFLADACGEDTALRAEVESLLHFHETTGSSDGEAPPEAAQFAPGQMFAGRYRMVARIGRGGMGDVWRADDVILQTPVALKVITSTAADQAGRILNEVRLARQITHPAVCRVFDVGNADEHSGASALGDTDFNLIEIAGVVVVDRRPRQVAQIAGRGGRHLGEPRQLRPRSGRPVRLQPVFDHRAARDRLQSRPVIHAKTMAQG